MHCGGTGRLNEMSQNINDAARGENEPAKKCTFRRLNNTRGQRQIREQFCYAIHARSGLHGLHERCHFPNNPDYHRQLSATDRPTSHD